MKKIFILIIFIFLSNCTNINKTFWCGDHPCVNKKEQQAYFKETMIVEIREISKKKLKKYSEIEEITKQAKKKEEEYISDEAYLKEINKIDEKARKKAEKNLLKRKKAEEKKQKKIESDIAKQISIEEKKNLKKNKKLTNRKIINNEKNSKSILDVFINNKKTGDFNKIVENIKKKNEKKSYPDINDIPN